MGQLRSPRGYLWRPGRYRELFAFFGHELDSRPPLPREQWERVDMLYEQVEAKMGGTLFVLLTDDPAQEAATYIYVLPEPCKSPCVVIALDLAGKQVSICADNNLWPSLEAGFRTLMDRAEQLLRQDDLIEALILALHKVRELLPPPEAPRDP